MLCSYGCGQEATYQFKNRKWCCGKSQNSCSVNKQKNSAVRKGKNTGPRSDDIKKKISAMMKEKSTHFQTEETRRKMSETRRGKRLGENNPFWKGGSRDYYHGLAWKMFGQQNCSRCGKFIAEYRTYMKGKRFDIHCMNKNFRDLSGANWITFCTNCHNKFEREMGNDYGVEKMRETRRKQERDKKIVEVYGTTN